MLSQLLMKWLQLTLRDADPEKLRSWVYLIQAGFGGAIILALIWLRQREAPSGFKVREADSKADHKRSASIPAEVLRLEGISIQGQPHEILGVKIGASEADIRAAYREKMKQYHPDVIARPGTREWKDAQVIAEAINSAKEKMLVALKKK